MSSYQALRGWAHRARAFVLLGIIAITVSACFVSSENRMNGSGPDVDPMILGAWHGVGVDGEQENPYLHVIKAKSGEGMTLVLVEPDSLMVMSASSVQAGPYRYLNATIMPIPGIGDSEPDKEKDVLGVHIVRYDLKGNRFRFWLLDAQNMAKAVESGKIKGTVSGSGPTRSARLTATPDELNAFFAKPEATQYFAEKPVVLTRLPK